MSDALCAIARLRDTAFTPRWRLRRVAVLRVRAAPKPLITRSVGEVTRPPSLRTSRLPAVGLAPLSIWTMYSARAALASAFEAPATSSRQIAAVSATANRSLKTIVSSAMRDVSSWLELIRQLSRLHVSGRPLALRPRLATGLP